jgi:hypothetical protein
MDRIMRPAVLLVAGLALAGCGGSSSGSNGGPEYQGYQKLIQGGEQVNASGNVRTTAAPDDPASANITFKVGRKSKDDVSRINVDARGAPVNFDLARGDTIGQSGEVAFIQDEDVEEELGVVGTTSVDGRSAGNFAKPGANDLEYMTFGAWLTGGGPDARRGGAGSFGVETGSADVPEVGSANYTGATTGLYVDAEGREHVTKSKFGASVNFRSRDVYMGTIDSWQRDLQTHEESENPGLNFAGGGRISGRSVRADVATGTMAGEAEGGFYGPDAKELGGTFVMRGNGGTYVGSFGGDGGPLSSAARPDNPAAGTPETGREFINSLRVRRPAE